MPVFAVFLFTALLPSCSGSHGVRADLERLRPWSPDLEQVQPLPPPFVVDYEQAARRLTFVAIEHANDPKHPSLRFLTEVMGKRDYRVVLLEGVPRSLGISPHELRDEALRESGGPLLKGGELSLAVADAAKKKLAFVGAEPDEILIRSEVLAAGFSLQDLFGFYVLRQIPHWKRDGSLTRESFPEVYGEARKGIGGRIGMGEADVPSLVQFLAWYEKRLARPFRVADVRPELTAPVPFGRQFPQQIAVIADRIRSQHILRVTEEMVNRYGRTLLVFSAPHFPVQQLALESMLGKPRSISDQP